MRLFQGTREDFLYGSAVASVQIAIFAVFLVKNSWTLCKKSKIDGFEFSLFPNLRARSLSIFLRCPRRADCLLYTWQAYQRSIIQTTVFEVILGKYRKSPISLLLFEAAFEVSRSQTGRTCSECTCFKVRERIFHMVQPLLQSR